MYPTAQRFKSVVLEIYLQHWAFKFFFFFFFCHVIWFAVLVPQPRINQPLAVEAQSLSARLPENSLSLLKMLFLLTTEANQTKNLLTSLGQGERPYICFKTKIYILGFQLFHLYS